MTEAEDCARTKTGCCLSMGRDQKWIATDLLNGQSPLTWYLSTIQIIKVSGTDHHLDLLDLARSRYCHSSGTDCLLLGLPLPIQR